MDSKRQFRLNYTEDFRVACGINNLNCDEVLQYFISKVSFYAFNGGEMDASAMMATSIIVQCKEETGGEIVPVTDKKIQKIFLKHIQILHKLSINPHLGTMEKIQESFYLMDEWSMEMLPLVDYESSIVMDPDHALILSFDFNLLCRINGLNIISVLQFFIDKISLAVDRAINLNGVVKAEPAMALFQMFLVSRTLNDKHIVKQEVYDNFVERLQDLDGWLSEENDIDKRISAYRTFYLEWFRKL